MGAFKQQSATVDVESVIADLRAIDHTTVWERTMAVGKVVYDGIFGGNRAEWRAKRGNKSKSLRKLVGHPQCPFKKSALSVAVNVYLFTQDCPDVRGLSNITPTHVSTVCSLPATVALELLNAASANGWTIRCLAEHVHRVRREAGERRGRPRSGSSQRAETMGRRSLRALQRMQALLEQGPELDEASRQRLLAVLESVTEICGVIQSSRQLRTPLRTITRVLPVAGELEHAGKVIGAA